MRRLVHELDQYLCRANGVFEFSQDEKCVLRLQAANAPHTIDLPDMQISTGEPILLIHLWNERLAVLTKSDPDLAQAKRLLKCFQYSLGLVARFLTNDGCLNDMRAIGGKTILLNSGLHEAGERIVQGMGFTVAAYSHRLGHFGEFWENLYSWLLIWTYNPGGRPRRSLLQLRRAEIWMSREDFMRRFGGLLP